MDEVMYSSATVEWETPQDFFDRLDAEFHFTLDPCSTHENAKCKKHFTQEDDGLVQDWTGETVYCNPPYGREMPRWIAKCADHASRGGDCCNAHSCSYRHESVSRLHLSQGRNQVYPWPSEIRRRKEQRPISFNGLRISA